MSKFKVGDRVMVTRDDASFARVRKGDSGVVAMLNGADDGDSYEVRMDDPWSGIAEWSFRGADLALTAPAPTPAAEDPALVWAKDYLTRWGTDPNCRVACRIIREMLDEAYGLVVQTIPASITFTPKG